MFVEETFMQWKMRLDFRISYQGLKDRCRCDLHLIHIQTFILRTSDSNFSVFCPVSMASLVA